MIVLLVLLTAGWVALNILGALSDRQTAGIYWAMLPVGTTLLLLVLAGVCTYLVLNVKAINLTRRQSNFIDSVTHELKSPIASLKLYLQTLSRRNVSPDEYADFCNFMLEDLKRLDDLINHVLDAGRVEKAVGDEEREDVELAALLKTCGESVCGRHDVSPDQITYETIPCMLTTARFDLELIFRNLIDNAIKYGGDEPEVHIFLRLDGDFAVVHVTDNGPGIPPKLRRKVFGRFVRLGFELERKKPGTGLGLYIVQTLVRRLHGKIRVHGRSGASGTVFEVRLPDARPVQSNPEQSGHSPSREEVEVQ